MSEYFQLPPYNDDQPIVEHPFYQWLKKQKPGFLGLENVKWNFTKFLIDQEGNVVDRFAPQAKPENLAEQIREML